MNEAYFVFHTNVTLKIWESGKVKRITINGVSGILNSWVFKKKNSAISVTNFHP